MVGEGDGTPLQYSCLENPMDRGAWWATVHGAAESDRTEQLTPKVMVVSSFPPVCKLISTMYLNGFYLFGYLWSITIVSFLRLESISCVF